MLEKGTDAQGAASESSKQDAASATRTSHLPSRRPARRDSLNIKGTRRVSQLRDGGSAYPHSDVPDEALYRHCSDQAPPVVRMKHLLNWTLHRSTDQALGAAQPKRRMRPGRTDPIDALLAPSPQHVDLPVSELDSQKYAEAAPIITRIIDETLRDLNDADQDRPRRTQPHPRNESNAVAAQQLENMLHKLEEELQAWKHQEHAIGDIDAATEALTERATQMRLRKDVLEDEDAEVVADVERVFEGHSALPDMPISWELDDADAQTKTHLEYALGVLRDVELLNSNVAAQGASNGTHGSELDPRINALEFSVDRLESQLYPVVQLDKLTGRYLAQVSARAAQTLAERATAGLATFSGTDTLTRLDSEPDAPLGQRDLVMRQQQLDELMAGVRDSCPLNSADASAVAHSDTHELLRALASRVDGS